MFGSETFCSLDLSNRIVVFCDKNTELGSILQVFAGDKTI